MDFGTFGGLLLGAGILVAALVLGQVPLETLVSPEALLLVFGGTLTSLLIHFPTRTLRHALRAGVACLFHTPLSPRDCVAELTAIGQFVRKEGLLALGGLIQGVEIPFLKKGLTLWVDNRSPEFLRESLTLEMDLLYQEDTDAARVFEAAGGFAPTMGIIGAVIGLIHVLQTSQPGQIGPGIATAFSATLYGVALSNLLLLPLAGKLRQRAREDWFRKTVLLEGLLSLRGGMHPLLIEQKLQAFVGEKAFTSAPVAMAQAWNSLEDELR